jgi:hypothetical protein
MPRDLKAHEHAKMSKARRAHALARLDDQIEMGEHGGAAGIGEGDILERHRSRPHRKRRGMRRIRQIMRHLRPDLSAASLEGDGGGGDLP